jgi:GTP-binding protein
MLPVVSLVGRPNVGKSTLFNRLTRTRDALVDDQPGVTRDRLYGKSKIGSVPFLVVDTGGLDADIGQVFASEIRDQVEQVLLESDIVLFIVDLAQGLVPQDIEIARFLRQNNNRVYLLVNKSEGVEDELATSEFQELALGEPLAISAKRGDGIQSLIDSIFLNNEEFTEEPDSQEMPIISIAGRPNVGKSTLTNRLAGESRVIVSDVPGTTRDSVQIPITFKGDPMIIIDTAGVRRKARVDEVIEKFSVIKTLQAIERSHVTLLVLDASVGIESQDSSIAGMVHDLGRSIVIVVNKWDGLNNHQKNQLKKDITQKLSFLPSPEIITISALHGSKIRDVLPAAKRAYDSAMIDIATSSLSRTLEQAVTQTPPPMNNQRPVRLKFAHQAGKNPPIIVIHGNQVDALPNSYRRYLARYFSGFYRLVGTPIRIITRTGENPFKARKPNLTEPFKTRSGRRRKL